NVDSARATLVARVPGSVANVATRVRVIPEIRARAVAILRKIRKPISLVLVARPTQCRLANQKLRTMLLGGDDNCAARATRFTAPRAALRANAQVLAQSGPGD